MLMKTLKNDNGREGAANTINKWTLSSGAKLVLSLALDQIYSVYTSELARQYCDCKQLPGIPLSFAINIGKYPTTQLSSGDLEGSKLQKL